jgi:hypothetical protein
MEDYIRHPHSLWMTIVIPNELAKRGLTTTLRIGDRLGH